MKKRTEKNNNFAGVLKHRAEMIDHEFDAAIEIVSVLDGYWKEAADMPYKNRKAFDKAVLKIVKD